MVATQGTPVNEVYHGPYSYTGPSSGPGTPGPIIAEPAPTYKQNVLKGVIFPSIRVTGFENVMNNVTAPTLPSITGVSVDSLKKNVTVPTAPAATAPAASESSMNWLWILIIIPIGIAAVASSKSK
jgi:hypothetical protein